MQKHYNKLIVNAKKSTEGSVCSHPKHEIYESTARPGKKETKVRKVPERLVKYFELPHTALMCRHCLYKSDNDPWICGFPQLSASNWEAIEGKSYVLRSDIIYSESQFQELESAYHDVCAELDETRLGMSTALYLSPDINSPLKWSILLELIPLSKKIKLMAGVLNNKFINGVKTEIGYLLDSAGVSPTALETIAGAGISIRRETVARYKKKQEANHIDTAGMFGSEHVSMKFIKRNYI